MKYPSDVIEQTFKLSPDPDMMTWEGATEACSHCGRPVSEGDLYSPVSLGTFFSDTRALASPSGMVCWRCAHLRKKPMMNGLSFAVITQDNVFPISQDIHKAWFFLTPPPAPFVAVHSSSTMQHLVWRTPVTLDNRRISIRFGPSLYHVRPHMMHEALDIADRYNEGAKRWVSPMLLDRKAAQPYHGQFRRGALDAISASEADFLLNLLPGEKWALAYLMHAKRPSPTKPEPITEKILSKL